MKPITEVTAIANVTALKVNAQPSRPLYILAKPTSHETAAINTGAQVHVL
jgi:hypothetical protein